jgi:hypothetical protein
MKKIVLLSIICAIGFNGFSQKFTGGIALGMNASQISGDQAEGYNKPGLMAGAFSNMKFGEKWSIQLELYYIMKGSRKVSKNSPWSTYKLNMHYVEMPLLVKWNFYKKFSIMAGPSLGVLIKAVEKDAYGVINNYDRPKFNLMDFGGIGGLEYAILPQLKVGFRASSSIIPVRKPQLNTSWRLDRWQYHTSLLLSLVYQFK